MPSIDERVFLWINGLVGKSADTTVLDRIMIWCANDYFIPVTMSFFLLAIWFFGRGRIERESYHRAVICAFITIGFAGSFVYVANHIYRHPHPFEYEANPELMAAAKAATDRIFYEIWDPSFPSHTAAVTFGAAAGLWHYKHKLALLMLIPAILMPFAKVYAAVYWPSDVVCGAILGIAMSYLIRYVVLPLVEPIFGRILAAFRKLCIA